MGLYALSHKNILEYTVVVELVSALGGLGCTYAAPEIMGFYDLTLVDISYYSSLRDLVLYK